MLEAKRLKMEQATRKANDRFSRAAEREAEFWRDKKKRFDADAAKTAKLRALRMAKEAGERETQAKEAEDKKAAAEAKKAGARAARPRATAQ